MKLRILALTFCLLASPLVAQQRLGSGPLSIEATQGIEWRRDQRVYIANGGARAVQGNVTVLADRLVAHYREDSGAQAEGGPTIYRVEAEGNVRITSGTETVTGTKAVYDLDRSLMVMTGEGLRLTTPTQTVTARDSLEYWGTRKVAVARGQAVAVEGTQRVQADVMTAHLIDAQGGTPQQIARVDGIGNVRISSKDAIATGGKGVYNLQTGIATLVGSVKVTQGRNQLNGDYAEVNLKTGVSRILSGQAGAGAGTPVRALLVPEAGSPPANTARPQGVRP